jgi:hypothetical protein
VIVTSPAPRDAWQRAVAADPLALADGTPAWTDAVCTERWRDASRLYTAPDGTEVVLPLVRRSGPLGWAASMPPGWGFGGLVGGSARRPEVVRAVAEDLRGLGLATARVRPLPQDGDLWADCGGLLLRKRAHVLDLTPGPDALFAGLRKSVRRSVRRREDVEVQVGGSEALLEAYERLWWLSVDRWGARQREPRALARRRALWRDPPARMRALAQHLGEDFRLWVASVDGQPVAANVVVLGPSAHATRAVSDQERAPSGVAQYLDWLGIVEAAERGCATYNLGESGTSQNLAFYKEGLGARGLDYVEVRFERLPLTTLDQRARSVVKRAIGFKG